MGLGFRGQGQFKGVGFQDRGRGWVVHDMVSGFGVKVRFQDRGSGVGFRDMGSDRGWSWVSGQGCYRNWDWDWGQYQNQNQNRGRDCGLVSGQGWVL